MAGNGNEEGTERNTLTCGRVVRSDDEGSIEGATGNGIVNVYVTVDSVNVNNGACSKKGREKIIKGTKVMKNLRSRWRNRFARRDMLHLFQRGPCNRE